MSTGVHKSLRRQDITFEDKDQALRDDVRTLGAMVGDLIREQSGDELFEFVENARLRAIRRREGNEKPGEELAELVGALDPKPPRRLFAAFRPTSRWSIRPRKCTAFAAAATTCATSVITSPAVSKTH